jgi:hypothetical protein
VFDDLGDMYGYTNAWVDLLAEALSNPEKFKEITGSNPISVQTTI